MAKGRLATEISRTSAMVAALYGYTTVLAYALYAAPREATQASSTDSSTALHLAAAGSTGNAVAATHLLLAASTEVLSISGLRAGDLLPRRQRRREAAPAPPQIPYRVAAVLTQEVRHARGAAPRHGKGTARDGDQPDAGRGRCALQVHDSASFHALHRASRGHPGVGH